MEAPQLPPPVFPPAATPTLEDVNYIIEVMDHVMAQEALWSIPQECWSKGEGQLILQDPLSGTRLNLPGPLAPPDSPEGSLQAYHSAASETTMTPTHSPVRDSNTGIQQAPSQSAHTTESPFVVAYRAVRLTQEVEMELEYLRTTCSSCTNMGAQQGYAPLTHCGSCGTGPL